MYNRYIPQPDGTYRRSRVPDQTPPKPHPQQPELKPQMPPEPPCPPPQPSGCSEPSPVSPEQKPFPPCRQNNTAGDFLRQLLPRNLDTGDLLIIILLLLMAGDCKEDKNTALLTLALYLFM